MTWSTPRSVGTKNKTRDEHLARPGVFDVASHPDITFTADGIRPDDAGVTVTGRLTIRGRARPLSFGAKVSSAGGEVTLDGKVQVNRADLGLTRNRMGMVPMHNTITVHAVFTRQQARPPTPLAARPLQAAQRAPAALTSPAAPPIVPATVDSRSGSSR